MPVSQYKTKNSNLGKIISPCKTCKRESNQHIKEEYNVVGDEGNGAFSWTNQYQIIQCAGCDRISFRTTHSNSEDIQQTGPNEWEYAETVKVYPNPMGTRHPVSETHFLPAKLRRIYNETMIALNEQQPVLAGVGIRAIVETICKEKQATGNNLFGKINDLVAKGALTSDGSVVLHKVRTLGNDAAHEVKPHTEAELNVAMSVVEHLIMQLYILPKLAESAFK